MLPFTLQRKFHAALIYISENKVSVLAVYHSSIFSNINRNIGKRVIQLLQNFIMKKINFNINFLVYKTLGKIYVIMLLFLNLNL